VKVTLDHPSSTFLPLAIQPIVKAGYTENATAPIGTGPYRFKAYVPGQQVDLVRNDSYWGKEPAIARVEVYIMTDSAAMVSAFQSGQLDFGLVSADLFAPLQQDFVLEADPMNMADLIALNNKRKPFDDPRVRQAIYYGIDRKEIIDGVFSSKAVPMYTNVSPAMDAYCNTELAESYPHDLAKARALLTQAGYPDGFRMTLTVPANYFQHVDTAQILVSQLAKLGIDVTIDSVEWGTWLQNVYTDRNYQATVIGLTGKVDPYAVMFRYTSGYKKNFFNYTDDAYDALLKQASVATDQTKYVSLLKQAQQLATKDAAAIWICDPEMTVAVRKNLKGYKFYFAGYYDFASLYFE
jgi:peptide/nickel transport system substrate-binding protein